MAPVILVPKTQLPAGLACLSCGARFPFEHDGRYVRHVVKCSRAHEEQERKMSLRERMGVFGGDRVIPDLEDWVARNRQAIIEKRKRI